MKQAKTATDALATTGLVLVGVLVVVVVCVVDALAAWRV